MKRLVDLKTYLPEKGSLVSIVACDMEIGFNRCAGTMVFKGDENGITDWDELYFESHGYTSDEKERRRERHEEIVEAIRSGAISISQS